MKALSIRWTLVLQTMSLVVLAATGLVLLHHSRTRGQFLRQLERTLATKCEEFHSVLGSGATEPELAAFLGVETGYLSSPYEYYYEIADGGGASLLASHNLGGRRLGTIERIGPGGLSTLPHPLRTGESVRVRAEALAAQMPGWEGARLLVGVSLAPLEEAVAGDLRQSLLAAAVGVAGLFVTLWVIVGRTLRRVAAITRRASAITSTNLRERLPVNGSGDELDKLSRVFNEMLSRLGRALEQMESFTSDAAHQLRTPLTRVRGELDLILRDGRGLSQDVRARLGETRVEVERMACTCSRLLLLASLDRGALEEGLRADDVDLLALLEDTVEQIGPLAAERGVEVRSTGREGIRVRCSQPLLLEALLNLLDNALRASPPGTTIDVSLRQAGTDALVTISDQGPGIPEEFREQIFRRFSRLPRQREGGTGLGLPIVRGIARAHGGEVRIESAPCGGAALVVVLPMADGAPAEFASEAQAPLHRAG